MGARGARHWQAVAQFLRDDPFTALDMFIDLTCVIDWAAPTVRRVLHLYSVDKKHRVRLLAGSRGNPASIPW